MRFDRILRLLFLALLTATGAGAYAHSWDSTPQLQADASPRTAVFRTPAQTLFNPCIPDGCETAPETEQETETETKDETRPPLAAGWAGFFCFMPLSFAAPQTAPPVRRETPARADATPRYLRYQRLRN